MTILLIFPFLRWQLLIVFSSGLSKTQLQDRNKKTQSNRKSLHYTSSHQSFHIVQISHLNDETLREFSHSLYSFNSRIWFLEYKTNKETDNLIMVKKHTPWYINEYKIIQDDQNINQIHQLMKMVPRSSAQLYSNPQPRHNAHFLLQ